MNHPVAPMLEALAKQTSRGDSGRAVAANACRPGAEAAGVPAELG